MNITITPPAAGSLLGDVSKPFVETKRQKRAYAEGLLYKTCFLVSKDTPNKINVNPLFSCQKGAFSYVPASYRMKRDFIALTRNIVALKSDFI
ncbi:hypothetical protein DW083_05395 [Parabacteroides sp. AF48-14]|nr:hypothetical protein DW083_05395 [Parabacteroides sp. AF48-14]